MITVDGGDARAQDLKANGPSNISSVNDRRRQNYNRVLSQNKKSFDWLG